MITEERLAKLAGQVAVWDELYAASKQWRIWYQEDLGHNGTSPAEERLLHAIQRAETLMT